MKNILCLLILCLFLFAQTGGRFHEEANGYTAVQNALGGTGTAGNVSPFSAHVNPALLSELSGIQIQIVAQVNSNTEDRKYPAYSAFDSRNGNEIYASSSLLTNDFNIGVYHRFEFGKQRLSVSFSRARTLNSNYFYQEGVIRNAFNQNQILGYQVIEVKENIYENLLGIAASFGKLNFGIGVALVTASDYEYFKGIRLSENAKTNDYDINAIARLENGGEETEKLVNTPFVSRAGFSYPLWEQLNIGVAYQMSYKMKFRPKFGSDISFKIPSKIQFGIQYHGGNELASIFLFDYEYINWAGFEQMLAGITFGKIYNDVHRFKFGMEHQVGRYNIPLRVGAIFENSKEDKDITKTIFSLGTSIRSGLIQFNLSLGYGYLTYSEKDLFPESIWINTSANPPIPYSDRKNFDTIDQTVMSFKIDILYSLGE